MRSHGEEHAVLPVVLLDLVGVTCPDIGEPSRHHPRTKIISVETLVVDTHSIWMERAVLRIQVGQGNPTTRSQTIMQARERRAHVLNVMHCHGAHNQVERGLRRRGVRDVGLYGLHVIDTESGDLLLKHTQHLPRHIHGGHGSHIGLDRQSQQAGASTKVHGLHVRLKRNGATDRRSHGLG